MGGSPENKMTPEEKASSQTGFFIPLDVEEQKTFAKVVFIGIQVNGVMIRTQDVPPNSTYNAKLAQQSKVKEPWWIKGDMIARADHLMFIQEQNGGSFEIPYGSFPKTLKDSDSERPYLFMKLITEHEILNVKRDKLILGTFWPPEPSRPVEKSIHTVQRIGN